MLESRTVHVVPELAPIVLVAEQLLQSVKRLLGVPAEQGPGFAQAVDGGGLEGAQHGKLTVQIVEFVQLLGQLDKVGHGVRPGANILVFENFLQTGCVML